MEWAARNPYAAGMSAAPAAAAEADMTTQIRARWVVALGTNQVRRWAQSCLVLAKFAALAFAVVLALAIMLAALACAQTSDADAPPQLMTRCHMVTVIS